MQKRTKQDGINWLKIFADEKLKLGYDEFVRQIGKKKPDLSYGAPDIDPCCPYIDDCDDELLEFFGIYVDTCCPEYDDDNDIGEAISTAREIIIRSNYLEVKANCDLAEVEISKYFDNRD